MNTTSTVVNQIENDQLIVQLHYDGIVHVYIKSNTEINIELQKIMVATYNEVTGGKKSLFVFESGEFVSITKEARENAILMEPNTPTLASAIVVKNLGYKIIADFYYKINKPKQPYKVFWNKEKALIWLKQLKFDE